MPDWVSRPRFLAHRPRGCNARVGASLHRPRHRHLAVGRQRHAKAGTAAGRRLDPDTPAEVLDDLARDGKAEAGAARPLGEVGAGLLELLEDQDRKGTRLNYSP